MSRIEIIVDSIRQELLYYQWVVLLKEKDKEQYLPIYISSAYINEIKQLLLGHAPSKPIDYELKIDGIDTDKLKIKSVLLEKSGRNKFNAELLFAYGRRIIKDSCTIGKAITISLTTAIPILIDEKVLNKLAVDVSSKVDLDAGT